jgi:hypothetical protein
MRLAALTYTVRDVRTSEQVLAMVVVEDLVLGLNSLVEDFPHRERLYRALFRYTLRRLEETLAATEDMAAVNRIEVSPDVQSEVEGMAWLKICVYQAPLPAGLVCTVTHPTTDNIAETVERIEGPTDRRRCRSCRLPDSDEACSALTHVAIGHRGDAPSEITYARCADGRSEILLPEGSPELCFVGPGGNRCAHRTLGPVELAAVPMSPLSLPEALDFLDAVWRLAFNGQHLLGISAMTNAAALALPAATRSEFDDRLSSVVDIIDRMTVPAPPMPGGAKAPSGSLQRIELHVAARLAGDPASAQRAQAGIDTIRRVLDVRNAGQHTGAARKLPGALAALGIAYPPFWPDAWDRIKAELVRAFGVLRDEVRTLT